MIKNDFAKQIVIPLSKSKIALILLGSLMFVGLGIWFINYPQILQSASWANHIKIQAAGYASGIFFGACAIFSMYKLSDNKPGLTISETGLADSSSGLSAGQILWSDIERISVIEIYNQKLIMLHVKNPQQYIEQQKNLIKRNMMEFNNRIYGAPLSITSNGLKISFDNLLSIITEKFEESRMYSL